MTHRCVVRPVCAVLSLIVTLPETTPVLEAAHLQDDLRRGGIEPWSWIVNASLAAAKTDHPLLKLRAEAERAQVAKVRDELAARFAVVPMQVEEPVGRDRLTALCQPAPSANIEETRRVAL